MSDDDESGMLLNFAPSAGGAGGSKSGAKKRTTSRAVFQHQRAMSRAKGAQASREHGPRGDQAATATSVDPSPPFKFAVRRDYRGITGDGGDGGERLSARKSSSGGDRPKWGGGSETTTLVTRGGHSSGESSTAAPLSSSAPGASKRPPLSTPAPGNKGHGGGIRSNLLVAEFTTKKKQIVSSLFTSNPSPAAASASASAAGAATKSAPGLKNSAKLPESSDDNALVAESFADLMLDPKLLSTLETHMKLSRLTPVQKLAIPVLMRGGDALVRSETGTGKTLTFLVPIVNKLVARTDTLTRADGLQAIILAPTRELALQIFSVLQQLLRNHIHIVPGVVTGGEKRKSEKARLRKGVNILIATPGRLLDHLLHTRCFSIASVKWLVLDEADRLTDMGFEKDVSAIVRALNGDRYGLIKEDRERRYGNSGNASAGAAKPALTAASKSSAEDGNEESDDEAEDGEIAVPELAPDYHKGSSAVDEGEQGRAQPRRHVPRQTILISATLKDSVQRLAGITLQDPSFVDASRVALAGALGKAKKLQAPSGSESAGDLDGPTPMDTADDDATKFTLPRHLRQTYAVVPLKLRLVTLAAFLLDHCGTKHNKALVFLSSRDSVDFHYRLFLTSKFGTASSLLSLAPASAAAGLEKELALTALGDDGDDSEPEDVDELGGGDANGDGTSGTGTGKGKGKGKGKAGATKSSSSKKAADSGRKGTLFESIPLFRLHGSMSQHERTEVYREFTKAKSGVLLCTDVAARGLDVPNVDWIVQFNTPGETSDYIHRVGRTARLGKAGNALIFLAPSEVAYIQTLEAAGVSDIAQTPLDSILGVLPEIVQSRMPSFASLISTGDDTADAEKSKKRGKRSGLLFSEEEAATAVQICFERNVGSSSEAKGPRQLKAGEGTGGEGEGASMLELAKLAYQSFIRAYATYPASLKGVFHVRSLHLGHLAKSFALREAPSDISTGGDGGSGGSGGKDSGGSSSGGGGGGGGVGSAGKHFDRRLSFRHDEDEPKRRGSGNFRMKRRAVDEFGNGSDVANAAQHTSKKARLFPKSMMKKGRK